MPRKFSLKIKSHCSNKDLNERMNNRVDFLEEFKELIRRMQKHCKHSIDKTG